MKIVSCLVLLLAAGLSTGCRMVNQAQYQLAGSGRGQNLQTTVTAADRQAVKSVLASTAATLKFQDMTELSLVPNVIGSWQQQDSENPIKLVARAVNDRVVIDLLHYPQTVGETLGYRTAKELLLENLRKKFGRKVVIIPKTEWIDPARDVPAAEGPVP